MQVQLPDTARSRVSYASGVSSQQLSTGGPPSARSLHSSEPDEAAYNQEADRLRRQVQKETERDEEDARRLTPRSPTTRAPLLPKVCRSQEDYMYFLRDRSPRRVGREGVIMTMSGR